MDTAAMSELRAITDLPPYSAFDISHEEPLATGYEALFADPSIGGLAYDGVLNDGCSRVVVFGSADLRKLALNEATNSNYLSYAASEEDDDSGVAEAKRQLATSHLFFIVDPAVHDPLRALFARMFMPKQMNEWRPIAERNASEIIGELRDKGAVDFLQRFAAEFSLRTIADILQMTPEERDPARLAVKRLADVFVLEPDAEQLAAIDDGFRVYIDVISSAIRRVRENAGADVDADWLIEAEANFRKLDFKELDFDVFAALNMIDSFHTTALGAANAFFMLLRDQPAYEELRQNPALVPAAALEGVRMLHPGHTDRWVTEDIEYEGIFIPKDTVLRMLWAAGNRDPKVFPNPGKFDLHRRATAEHSFGGGARMCPGRMFGRFLIESLFRELLGAGLEATLAVRDYRLIPGLATVQLDDMPVTLAQVAATV